MANMPKKTAPKKKARTYMRKSQRRAMIVKAAIPIFTQKGFHGTTIEDICKSTGIAQGTVYIHFKNKLEIFKEIIIDIQKNFSSLMDPLFANKQKDVIDMGNEALNYIKQKTLLFFNLIKKNKDLIKMLFQDAPGLDPEIDDLLLSIKNRMLAQIETEHAIFQRVGLIKKVDPKLSAQMTLGTMAMVCMNNILEKNTSDLETLVDQVCGLIFYGLVVDQD